MRDTLVEKLVKFTNYDVMENGLKVKKSYSRDVGGIYETDKGTRYVKINSLFGTLFFDIFPPNPSKLDETPEKKETTWADVIPADNQKEETTPKLRW